MLQTSKTVSDDIVISVKNITKKFRVYFDKGSSLKERVLFKNRNRYEDRWVINGVSFDVRKGEALGLIGQNGCGKSTTLKLLTRIMYPNSGTVEIKGRVSSLIELGAGFHPDMSGRENIYINASIFGLSKKEIDERLQDIIDFSELHDYIDNPVRTYSSGMYTRLAFSVAVNVDADVLLIDEILAVGDASFQSKCFNKMMEIKAKGTTIVLVSHSLGDVEKICDKAIWIKDGKINMLGVPRDVLPSYLSYMASKSSSSKNTSQDENNENNDIDKANDEVELPPPGNQRILIKDVEVFDKAMNNRYCFATGDSFYIRMNYESDVQLHEDVNVGIAIYRNDGVHCYGSSSLGTKSKLYNLNEKGFIYLYIDKCTLLSGKYTIDLALAEKDGTQIDYKKNIIEIEIQSTLAEAGINRVEHKWLVDQEPDEVNSDMDIDVLDNNLFIEKLQEKLMNTQTCWGDKARIHLGKNVSMVNTLYNTSSGDIYIGDNTFTGHNVCLITGTHYIDKTDAERMQYPTEGRDIIIGNGVWICSNVTILGPCKIEDNAVIAAGSVVTAGSVVKANSVYGGVPAKFIKEV